MTWKQFESARDGYTNPQRPWEQTLGRMWLEVSEQHRKRLPPDWRETFERKHPQKGPKVFRDNETKGQT